MNILLTIVIPVFNVETYLRSGLDSVLCQIDDRVEAIAVDDGSPDGSGKILDDYVTQIAKGNRAIIPNNFKVIHQSNAGVSVARNTGIEASHGKWITFMDPDDAYVDGAIPWLLGVLEKTDADIVHYTSEIVDDQNKPVPFVPGVVHTYDMSVQSNRLEVVKNIYPIAWNCCYRVSQFADIRYVPGLAKSQDMVYGFECLCKARKIESHETKVYKYFQRDDSCVHTLSEKRVRGCIEASAHIFSTGRAWEHYDEIRPVLFRKVRVTTIGEAAELIPQFPVNIKRELWSFFFDRLSPIFLQEYVPILSRPFYRLAFALCSSFLVIWTLHKPYMLAKRLLENKQLKVLWQKIR